MQSKKKTLIICIHGFARDNRDMQFLYEKFLDTGYDAYNANLPTTFGSLQDCIDALHQQINDLLREYTDIHIVCHSMGGIILRGYLAQHKTKNIHSLTLIGTPYHGSQLARMLSWVPFYTQIFKPIRSLIPRKVKIIPDIPKSIPLQLIIGTKPFGIGQYLLAQPNDGRVSEPEALTQSAQRIIYIDEIHHRVQKTQEAFTACLDFINTYKKRA
jgi:pimeloyl-ACP methyl ester carboxylesterase